MIVAAGPGDLVPLRIADTIASLTRTVPRIEAVVIIDDEPAARRTFAVPAVGAAHCVPAARNGEGDGWKGGLACSLLHEFERLDPTIDWWVKCDDDSCAATPLAASLLPSPALPAVIGVVDWLYGHRKRDLGPINRYVAAAAGGRRIPPQAVAPLRGTYPGRDFRKVVGELVASCRDRTPVARHPHGGGYLFSRAALAASRQSGVLSTAEQWLDGDLGEDVAVGLCFRASGATIIDASVTGVRLAIERTRLPALPRLLREDRVWLTHSTKRPTWAEELELRRGLEGLSNDID